MIIRELISMHVNEIPLILTLFYIFHEVEVGLPFPTSSLKVPLGSVDLGGLDIIEWRVWLRQHIC